MTPLNSLPKAPWWLPGGNMQTIWPALYARRYLGPPPAYLRERWTAPDGDFVDVDFLQAPSGDALAGGLQPVPRALVVLFHGLEGSSRSHYAESFAHWAQVNGLAFAVPHFRGCSGELNTGPRAYHSGDWQEIDWILRRMAATPPGVPVLAAGVSLGGNALMRWAGEMGRTGWEANGAEMGAVVRAVASISSPLDLAASGECIGRGFNRQVYTRMFLNTMKPKALRKLAQHPGLFDAKAVAASRDLYEFDNVFTAPLHGFADTHDYWSRASAKPVLSYIDIPALCLNPLNDPFVPSASLPVAGAVGPHVTLWQPPTGGHVGFGGGAFPAHVMGLPQAVGSWLLAQLESSKHG